MYMDNGIMYNLNPSLKVYAVLNYDVDILLNVSLTRYVIIIL